MESRALELFSMLFVHHIRSAESINILLRYRCSLLGENVSQHWATTKVNVVLLGRDMVSSRRCREVFDYNEVRNERLRLTAFLRASIQHMYALWPCCGGEDKCNVVGRSQRQVRNPELSLKCLPETKPPTAQLLPTLVVGNLHNWLHCLQRLSARYVTDSCSRHGG